MFSPYRIVEHSVCNWRLTLSIEVCPRCQRMVFFAYLADGRDARWVLCAVLAADDPVVAFAIKLPEEVFVSV